MGDEQRQAAKVQMMVLMQAGYPWQEACAGYFPDPVAKEWVCKDIRGC